MGYITCETAAATLIKAIDGYSEKNVSSGDYRILTRGIAKAVVLQPGPFNNATVASPGWMRTQWTIFVEMYVPFGGEMSTVAGNIRTYRQEIINQLDKYPTLNSTPGVVLALLQSGGEPEIWSASSEYLWRQIMALIVEERQQVTYDE
jgi:hypothetical protein